MKNIHWVRKNIHLIRWETLCAEYVVKNHKKLENKVYDVPSKIDEKVAQIKLKSMGITIDKLTKEQDLYLNSWERNIELYARCY